MIQNEKRRVNPAAQDASNSFGRHWPSVSSRTCYLGFATSLVAFSQVHSFRQPQGLAIATVTAPASDVSSATSSAQQAPPSAHAPQQASFFVDVATVSESQQAATADDLHDGQPVLVARLSLQQLDLPLAKSTEKHFALVAATACLRSATGLAPLSRDAFSEDRL